VFLLLVLAVVILTVIGLWFRGPYWNFYWPWEPWPEIPARI
jgi:cytochrome b-561